MTARKKRTNLDALEELATRRARAATLLYNVDTVLFREICKHCCPCERDDCLHNGDHAMALGDIDKCVSGTLAWLESEEDKHGG